MNKKLLFTALIFGLLQMTMVSAQTKTTDKNTEAKHDSLMPYQKYPKLPAFKILEMDSVTTFNTYDIPTGKPVLLMFFGPDCDHCKHLTEELIKGMDSLKNLQFYMLSFGNPSAIKGFYDKFHLENYPNIKVVGKDADFFFTSFYGARFVPYLAVYDKHKKFVKKFEGGATIKELYEASRK
jgi:thiol-disulfide isomerase/thioredoxin